MPDLVRRVPLLAKMNGVSTSRVTVMSAPPGSGKSSLIRLWMVEYRASGGRVAYLAVDRGEQDHEHFWLAVGEAVADTVGGPAPTPGAGSQALIDRIIETTTTIDEPLVLVVDDLHELDSATGREQLEQFIKRMPAGLHLILATRRDLRLGLHQLRLSGELLEIRAAELLFSPAEARKLLDAAGAVLTDTSVSRLHERTEGWAAGLALAANSLRQHADAEQFVATFSGSDHAVAEYLFAEMLEAQDPEVQRLLLRTSIVDRISGPLADVLTERSGTEALLHQLLQSSGFVVALDPAQTWFRYHHLLSDLLRLELRRREPDVVPELHRRAAQWLEAHDQFSDAILHAQQAEDWSLAARLMAQHSFTLALDGREATIHALLAAFPSAQPTRDAGLAAVTAADQLAQGSLSEAGHYLEVAERLRPSVPLQHRQRHDAGVTTIKLALARRRADFRDVLELTRSLTVGAPTEKQDNAVGDDVRAVALMNLGIVEVWALRLEDGERHLLEGARLSRRIGRPFLEVGCLAHLALAGHRVSFAEVLERAEAAIELATEHGWQAESVVAPAYVVAAGATAWLGRFEESASYLARAEHSLRPELEPGVGLLFHVATGLSAFGRQRPREALLAYEAAERMQLELASDHPMFLQVRSFRMQAQTAVGSVAAARTALEDVPSEGRETGEIRLAEATILRAEGQTDRALHVLAPILAGSASVLHAFTTVHAHLIAAAIHNEVGSRQSTERAIEAALALAEPDGLMLPFAVTDSAALLERHPRHSTEHGALADEILDVLHGRSRPDPAISSGLREPMTDSERRVLGYLPSNLSTRDIADALFLSVNTVKVHMRRIYTKLDAHSRTEAIRRARALGLITRSAHR